MNGVPFSEMVKHYGTKGEDGFGIRGYKVPKQPEKDGLRPINVLKMKKEEQKYSKSYINTLIKHSKGVPDPRKYSKIVKWCDVNVAYNDGKNGRSSGKFGTEEKVTLFAKMSK